VTLSTIQRYVQLSGETEFKVDYNLQEVVAEKADRTALSGIAVQHADDGYCRRENFGGSLVHIMLLMYSPDGTDVHGSKGEEFRGYCRCS